MPRLPLPAIFVLAGAPAWAEPPQVATDIAPVHALVARVMDGIAEPELVLPPGASPHGHQFRPSEAGVLSRADIVVWIGPELSPSLARSVESLAPDAVRLGLLDDPATTRLELRENPVFGADGEDEGHDRDHDHDHDHGHDGHDGENVDPHAWLDPDNARAWLGLIAETLAEADPENADGYRANAVAGGEEIAAAEERARAAIERFGDRHVAVFHDAYQYFEEHFGLHVAGSIALSDATEPSPARIAELRDALGSAEVVCVFAEPQFNPGLVEAVREGSAADTAVLDPLGSHLQPGPDFYPQLIEDLAGAIESCG